MQRRNKPEVLAPAGNLRGLKTAVDYGADAVYCGGKAFGMRSAPKKPEPRGFRGRRTLRPRARGPRVRHLQRAAAQQRGGSHARIPRQAEGHRCGRADRLRHRRDAHGQAGGSEPRTACEHAGRRHQLPGRQRVLRTGRTPRGAGPRNGPAGRARHPRPHTPTTSTSNASCTARCAWPSPDAACSPTI